MLIPGINDNLLVQLYSHYTASNGYKFFDKENKTVMFVQFNKMRLCGYMFRVDMIDIYDMTMFVYCNL